MSAALDGSFNYPVAGAGAGAIERVLSPYLDWSKLPIGVVPTIENEPVQWLLEFGWIVGLAAILLLASYVWFGVRAHTRGSRLRYGAALAAGLFLAFNAQIHFPFFTLGIAIPAVFLLETSIARAAASETSTLVHGYFFTDKKPLRWVIVAVIGGMMIICLSANVHYTVELMQISEAESREQEFERLNRLVPSEGEIYAHAARSAGSEERSKQLAHHAVELEPTAQMKLFFASELWRSGDQLAAVSAYQEVFSDAYPTMRATWIQTYVVRAIRDPLLIAMALRNGDQVQWRVAARAIRDHFGAEDEIRFATKLIEERPKEYEPYEIIIQAYLRSDEPEIAELWANLLISQSLEGPNGETPAGFPLLVRSRWQQGKRAEARALALHDSEKIAQNEELAILLVRLRSRDPKQATPTEVEAISMFRSTYCSRLDTRRQRHWCWLAEGWLAEREGALDDAEFAYRRLQRKHDTPDFLGTFFARHGMCIELNELISGLESGDGRLGRVGRLTDDCAATGNTD
jgi:hypothetical protein